MRGWIVQFAADAATWAICVLAIAFLSVVGVIDDAAFALASGGLWLAIRKRGEG